jgi:hypothetical protein
VVIAVLLVVVGPARPRQTALLPPRSIGKPEAAAAVDKLLMMGMRMLETCWVVFKREAINLRNCCIWLVDSFECMMMDRLANPKLHYNYRKRLRVGCQRCSVITGVHIGAHCVVT